MFATATKCFRSDSAVFSKATVQCFRSVQVPQSVFEATVQCFRRLQQSRSRQCSVLEAFKCHEAISKRQYNVFGVKAGAKPERSSLGTPRPEGKFKDIYIYIYIQYLQDFNGLVSCMVRGDSPYLSKTKQCTRMGLSKAHAKVYTRAVLALAGPQHTNAAAERPLHKSHQTVHM